MNGKFLKDNLSLIEIEKLISNRLDELDTVGEKLWGDINLSQDEYEILKNKIKEQLSIHSLIVENFADKYPIVFTTLLVFFAKYEYDKNFWGLLAKDLGISAIFGANQKKIALIAKKMLDKYEFAYNTHNDVYKNLAPIVYQVGSPPEECLGNVFYILKDNIHKFEPELVIEDIIGQENIRKYVRKFFENFKDDARSVQFIVDAYDAILSVEQNVPIDDSRFVQKYSEWKEDNIGEFSSYKNRQKNQEEPYLFFDNDKGLCLNLPDTLLSDIDDSVYDVYWEINSTLNKKLEVFREGNKLYSKSIIIPISATSKYKVKLICNNKNKLNKDIVGIDSFAIFNSRGRRVYNPKNLSSVEILVCKNKTSYQTENLELEELDFPTDNQEYQIIRIIDKGNNGKLTINTPKTSPLILNANQKISLYFEGETLFSLKNTEENNLYTELPIVIIELGDNVRIDGFSLKIGKNKISIDDFFNNGVAEIDLRNYQDKFFNNFGFYSIKLYRNSNYIKTGNFYFIPKIESNYRFSNTWNIKDNNRCSFKKGKDYELEFKGCSITNTKEEYIITPYGLTEIPIKMTVSKVDTPFTIVFNLPISPFEFSVLDKEEVSRKLGLGNTIYKGFKEISSDDIWCSFKFFEQFKNYNYKLRLTTINGVKQEESLKIPKKGSLYKNLSIFFDSLQNCPLPAYLELYCEDRDKSTNLIKIVDTDFANRADYSEGYLIIDIPSKTNLTLTSFFNKNKINLPYTSYSFEDGGFKIEQKLEDGFYLIEKNVEKDDFSLSDDEISVNLTTANNIIYVSSVSEEKNFSYWLDIFIKKILLNQSKFDDNLDEVLSIYKGTSLLEFDLERLIALAYFYNDDKCSNENKTFIKKLMIAISKNVLNVDTRLELIRKIVEHNCPKYIFDTCMDYYHIILFSTNSKDALSLAEKVEENSKELSMLLRLGANESINSLFPKYLDIIGGVDILKKFITVPNVENEKEILNERKKFLKEEPSAVKIELNTEISGTYELIQKMYEYYPEVKFIGKPEEGDYFYGKRFIDLYYECLDFKNKKEKGLIKVELRENMEKILNQYYENIPNKIRNFKFDIDKKFLDMTEEYLKILESRFPRYIDKGAIKSGQPYFLFQGLAAYIIRLSEKFKQQKSIYYADKFLVEALQITTEFAKRDIIMASLYIYLKMKEN